MMTEAEGLFMRQNFTVAPFRDSAHILITDYNTIKESPANSELYQEYKAIVDAR